MVLFDCMACAILAYPNGGRFWLKLVLQMLRSGCDEIAGAGGYSRVAGLGLLGVLGYASFFTWLWDCQLRAFPGD